MSKPARSAEAVAIVEEIDIRGYRHGMAHLLFSWKSHPLCMRPFITPLKDLQSAKPHPTTGQNAGIHHK
jgi:hypothetical protein